MSISYQHYFSTSFEAARSTADKSLHGHSFVLEGLFEEATAEQAVIDLGSKLDYQHLNETCKSDCEDTGLIQSFAELLPNPTELRLKSGPSEGVAWRNGEILLWQQSTFHSAHFLPNVPKGHKCGNLHGHTFKLTLVVKGEAGKVLLNQLTEIVLSQLNHRLLNEISGLENPTSEKISLWVWELLSSHHGVLKQVLIQETATAGCSYDGVIHRIWKRQDAESAIYLKQYDNPIGYSYMIRLHIEGMLDEVMGWTVDYGDIKSIFKPTYQKLDHHCINDLINGEPNGLSIAEWIYKDVFAQLPQISGLDVFEAENRGVMAAISKDSMASIPRLMV